MKGIDIDRLTARYDEALQCQASRFNQYKNEVWMVPHPTRGTVKTLRFEADVFGKYLDSVKTYIYYLMQIEMDIYTVCKHLTYIRLLFEKNKDLEDINVENSLEGVKDKWNRMASWKSFLYFINYDDDTVLYELDQYSPTKKHGPRNVADFISMYRMNDCMTQFYKTASSDDLKYYYPLLIWWKIGGVIPFRPTELTLIRKDCIHYDETVNKWILEIPTIKEAFSSSVKYESIAISAELAELITDYQKLVEYDSDRPYLFSELEYEKRTSRVSRADGTKRQFVNRADLTSILRSFETDILENQQHMTIVERGKVIVDNPHCIERMELGDLRHYAIYNLLSAGLDPYAIARFARHKNISTQTNYYGHIANMSMGKVQVISDKITMNAGDNLRTYENRTCSAFKEREIELLNIEREDTINKDMMPIMNGFCSNHLNCVDGADCNVCLHYHPDSLDENAADIIEAEYKKEIGKLADVCETMRMIYSDKSGSFDKLKTLTKERESHVVRAAIIKSKIDALKG